MQSSKRIVSIKFKYKTVMLSVFAMAAEAMMAEADCTSPAWGDSLFTNQLRISNLAARPLFTPETHASGNNAQSHFKSSCPRDGGRKYLIGREQDAQTNYKGLSVEGAATDGRDCLSRGRCLSLKRAFSRNNLYI